MYTKLAITNIKNNRQFYFPYLLTGIITVAMFYIMCALESNPGIQSMPGAKDLGLILRLGIGVIGIFAVIFLFYTNSFIIKRRKKELGIYNILGMEKRHIARVLEYTKGNKTEAARLLKIGLTTLYRKIEEYKI
jgi:putative ABC transport system permease protein